MNDKEKIKVLRRCFEDTIWMAIRYADKRSTYAPSMVRESVLSYKAAFPDFELKPDPFIKAPKMSEFKGISFQSDCLYDLFKTDKDE